MKINESLILSVYLHCNYYNIISILTNEAFNYKTHELSKSESVNNHWYQCQVYW